MTETFKNQLLKYLVGKLDIQNGYDQPYFRAINRRQNDLYTYIANNVVQPQTSTYHLIKGKDSNGNDLDEHILYGIDEDDNSGFIIILDSTLTPIQFINSYAGGTKFGVFEELIIDDDGRFYGIEFVSSKRRFIMLNNILVKDKTENEYKVVLRQSYELPNSLQSGTFNKLIKKPLANKYLLCATTSNHHPLAVQLTISVSGENQWVEYEYTDNNCSISGAWASWNERDVLTFKLACTYTSGNTGYLYILYNSDTSIALLQRYNLPEPTANWIQAVILNESDIYLGYCYTDGDGVYNQYIDKVESSLTRIFKSPNTDIAMPGSLIKSSLYTDGYNVFVSFNVPNDDDTIDYYMGIVYNDVVYYNNFGDLTYTTSQLVYATNTFHQFNLYTYYLQLGDMAYEAVSIFNNLNFNGPAYSNTNGLIPNSVVLSTNYEYPLFARNLYNKVVSDNVTIATVEIPNTLMNYDLGPAYEIETQELYSETNQKLINNKLTIDKNIYETVNINFYNTLKMKDNNNPTNSILNLSGAIKVNQSISKDEDYFDVQAAKVRINYEDGTNNIVSIDPSSDITITNGVATYSFVIYTPSDKQVSYLEIISNDKQVSYAKITGTFGKDKYYRITQNVYVE